MRTEAVTVGTLFSDYVIWGIATLLVGLAIYVAQQLWIWARYRRHSYAQDALVIFTFADKDLQERLVGISTSYSDWPALRIPLLIACAIDKDYLEFRKLQGAGLFRIPMSDVLSFHASSNGLRIVLLGRNDRNLNRAEILMSPRRVAPLFSGPVDARALERIAATARNYLDRPDFAA